MEQKSIRGTVARASQPSHRFRSSRGAARELQNESEDAFSCGAAGQNMIVFNARELSPKAQSLLPPGIIYAKAMTRVS